MFYSPRKLSIFVSQSLGACALIATLAFACLFSDSTSTGKMQSKFESNDARQMSFTPNALSFVNFQTASNVLGQSSFTTNTPGSSLSQFDIPLGTVVDPATGKIFVSDSSNHRVLRFPASAATVNGSAAELVFGVTGSPGTTATQFNSPVGLAIDSAGRLWVADRANSRVLRFDNAATIATNSPSANGVLGQPDFTTSSAGITQSTVNNPYSVSVDSAGRLWVADGFNNRVLRFDNAAAKANGANADGVLGQPDFVTSAPATTQSKMNFPTGVFIDSAGRLWVSESSNNRVLRFDNAAAKPNGANADGVLGQPDFVTSAPATTQSKMNNPIGLSTDSIGRLYVGDFNNSRLLIFNNAATLPNGANASNVLGQPNFTTAVVNNGGITASSSSGYAYPHYHEASNSLFVADANNNRVLRFVAAGPTAAGVSISGRVIMPQELGLTNALVTLTDSQGNSRTILTRKLGNFRFEDVAAGETYIISVTARRYTFASQVVTPIEDIADLSFSAQQ